MVAAAVVAGFLASAALVAAGTWGRSSPPRATRVVEAGRSRSALERERSMLLRDAPETQAAALADRKVTVAEYQAAVHRTMRCLGRDLAAARPDLAVHPPSFTGPAWSADRFTFAYDFRLVVSDLDPRPYDRACQQRHSRSIEALFHLQRWSDPAYVRRTRAAFHTCLDDAHLPGREIEGPRARFRAVITDPAVGAQAAIEARKCIGAHPSIGDLNP
jgi:hypothetical protein